MKTLVKKASTSNYCRQIDSTVNFIFSIVILFIYLFSVEYGNEVEKVTWYYFIDYFLKILINTLQIVIYFIKSVRYKIYNYFNLCVFETNE